MIKNLSTSRVFSVLSTLSGITDQSANMDLCVSAARSICSRLKPGCDITLHEAELCYAAGCLAFYRYTLINVSDNMSVFKAGDVTINSGGKEAIEAARTLLDDALVGISDCLRENGFCFRTV